MSAVERLNKVCQICSQYSSITFCNEPGQIRSQRCPFKSEGRKPHRRNRTRRTKTPVQPSVYDKTV